MGLGRLRSVFQGRRLSPLSMADFPADCTLTQLASDPENRLLAFLAVATRASGEDGGFGSALPRPTTPLKITLMEPIFPNGR
jgi:hypothetical protein